ncbi:uncharacterized protein LOC129705962 isoform X3 [Leucoraja erinacea]|uniref:uncharacterized protein LOC129705962 isoform X3 n=1 Tax=Leucoraja erinaceus TaxID=7782 RepID=UPI0024575507|nr:uncharacterized protein LOC129705962 isoform X3 [Leucoraja erinacea]
MDDAAQINIEHKSNTPDATWSEMHSTVLKVTSVPKSDAATGSCDEGEQETERQDTQNAGASEAPVTDVTTGSPDEDENQARNLENPSAVKQEVPKSDGATGSCDEGEQETAREDTQNAGASEAPDSHVTTGSPHEGKREKEKREKQSAGKQEGYPLWRQKQVGRLISQWQVEGAARPWRPCTPVTASWRAVPKSDAATGSCDEGEQNTERQDIQNTGPSEVPGSDAITGRPVEDQNQARNLENPSAVKQEVSKTDPATGICDEGEQNTERQDIQNTGPSEAPDTNVTTGSLDGGENQAKKLENPSAVKQEGAQPFIRSSGNRKTPNTGHFSQDVVCTPKLAFGANLDPKRPTVNPAPDTNVTTGSPVESENQAKKLENSSAVKQEGAQPFILSSGNRKTPNTGHFSQDVVCTPKLAFGANLLPKRPTVNPAPDTNVTTGSPVESENQAKKLENSSAVKQEGAQHFIRSSGNRKTPKTGHFYQDVVCTPKLAVGANLDSKRPTVNPAPDTNVTTGSPDEGENQAKKLENPSAVKQEENLGYGWSCTVS